MRHLERTKALLEVFVVILLVFSITGCKNIGSLFDTNGKNTSYEIPEDAFVVVTDSTINIKGKQVKLRDSVSAWVKVLGEPDRDSGLFDTYPNNLDPLFYVWDSLGVTIRTYDESEKPEMVGLVRFFDIHLSGMDSEVARKGWFEQAGEYNFPSLDSTEYHEYYLEKWQSKIENNPEKRRRLIEDVNYIWKLKKKDRDFRRYNYPYHHIPDTIYMNGAPIHADDKLAELNARRKAGGVQQFSYVDRTSGLFIMQSDKASGDTTTMMSAFHYIAYPLNERDSLNFRYKLKVAGDRIHYIRVYLEGEEYW